MRTCVNGLLILIIFFGTLLFEACSEDPVDTTYGDETEGCTDPDATNFDPDATYDDGSCMYDNGGGNNDSTSQDDYGITLILVDPDGQFEDELFEVYLYLNESDFQSAINYLHKEDGDGDGMVTFTGLAKGTVYYEAWAGDWTNLDCPSAVVSRETEPGNGYSYGVDVCLE